MHLKRGLIIGVAVLVVLVFAWPSVYFLAGPFGAWQARVRLLSKTDHEALLKAGREILSQVHVEADPNGHQRPGSLPVPRDVKMPAAIKRLRPRRWAVDCAGYLTIEMHGGMDHFGVMIYPADFNEPYPQFAYGNRKLIDGLWYYDENYYTESNYGVVIDALLAKNRYQRRR
ncbi:MAG: hypothetical protein JW993_14430 [Sedimentisphaerales bacterium]|nr:hypothetical protein [Sedimentisphaerales bacterium]